MPCHNCHFWAGNESSYMAACQLPGITNGRTEFGYSCQHHVMREIEVVEEPTITDAPVLQIQKGEEILFSGGQFLQDQRPVISWNGCTSRSSLCEPSGDDLGGYLIPKSLTDMVWNQLHQNKNPLIWHHQVSIPFDDTWYTEPLARYRKPAGMILAPRVASAIDLGVSSRTRIAGDLYTIEYKAHGTSIEFHETWEESRAVIQKHLERYAKQLTYQLLVYGSPHASSDRDIPPATEPGSAGTAPIPDSRGAGGAGSSALEPDPGDQTLPG